MNNNERLTLPEHVVCTMDFINQTLKLQRLVELTHGHAEPGWPAFALVYRLLYPDGSPDWVHVSKAGTPETVLKYMESCLTYLEASEWNEDRLRAALVGAAVYLSVEPWRLEDLLTCMTFRAPNRIPLPNLLVLFGREQSLQLLRRNCELFRTFNLIS